MQVFKQSTTRSDRHLTFRIGSTDIGIVFPFWDQKNTNVDMSAMSHLLAWIEMLHQRPSLSTGLTI